MSPPGGGGGGSHPYSPNTSASGAGVISHPSYSSSTWERGGSTSSLNNNKMFVPQPLGSAPAPLHHHHHHPRLQHTLSNSQLGSPYAASQENNNYGHSRAQLGAPPPPPPVKSRLYRQSSETSVTARGHGMSPPEATKPVAASRHHSTSSGPRYSHR